MVQKLQYGTVANAIDELRQQGYLLDFNLAANCIVCNAQRFSPEEFDIVKVYRYEGDTDPADEAAVFAIESKSGLKGILVTAYGVYSDTMSAEMLEKLQVRK